MSEISKYESYKKKLQGICDEHDLVFRFKKDSYPITLTIRPAGGMDRQISMLENVEEEGYTSPDAYIRFTMKDGVLAYKMDKAFAIDDALFAKIKNLFKNMYSTYLEFFYRDVMERKLLSKRNIPVIDEDEDNGAEGEPEEPNDGDGEAGGDLVTEYSEDDPDVKMATSIVRQQNKASVSLLQRQMKIGYSKATSLMKALEEFGVVGAYNGSTPREVLSYDEPDEGIGSEEVPGDDEA